MIDLLASLHQIYLADCSRPGTSLERHGEARREGNSSFLQLLIVHEHQYICLIASIITGWKWKSESGQANHLYLALRLWAGEFEWTVQHVVRIYSRNFLILNSNYHEETIERYANFVLRCVAS